MKFHKFIKGTPRHFHQKMLVWPHLWSFEQRIPRLHFSESRKLNFKRTVFLLSFFWPISRAMSFWGRKCSYFELTEWFCTHLIKNRLWHRRMLFVWRELWDVRKSERWGPRPVVLFSTKSQILVLCGLQARNSKFVGTWMSAVKRVP